MNGVIRAYVGMWGTYPIPNEIYSKVSKWKKNGFPYQKDPGRIQFMQWVAKAEGEAMERLGTKREVSHG